MEFKSNSPVKDPKQGERDQGSEAKILKKFIKQNLPSELETRAQVPSNRDSENKTEQQQITYRLPPKGRYVNKQATNQQNDPRKILMELQNIEDGFSSRVEISQQEAKKSVEPIDQKARDVNRTDTRVLQPRQGNIDQSMIGNKDMPWSSIPQKEIAFQNVEQVG